MMAQAGSTQETRCPASRACLQQDSFVAHMWRSSRDTRTKAHYKVQPGRSRESAQALWCFVTDSMQERIVSRFVVFCGRQHARKRLSAASLLCLQSLVWHRYGPIVIVTVGVVADSYGLCKRPALQGLSAEVAGIETASSLLKRLQQSCANVLRV